jgi:hypothetical protein
MKVTQTTNYDIENIMKESENNEPIVNKDGMVYRPTDPLVHPYGTPRDAWSPSAVLTVVETPLLFVTIRVTTFCDKVTMGTAVGWGVGMIPIMGEYVLVPSSDSAISPGLTETEVLRA